MRGTIGQTSENAARRHWIWLTTAPNNAPCKMLNAPYMIGQERSAVLAVSFSSLISPPLLRSGHKTGPLLNCQASIEDALFIKRLPDNLQSKRQSLRVDASGH